MAFDAFLKIEGIDGESTDQQHKGEIDVFSWSWGATQAIAAGTGGGGTAGKVSMQDFHFTTRVNKASPVLFASCASGKHIDTATLSVRKAGDRSYDYIKITLSDVLVSGYLPAGAPDDAASEEVSLNFAKIEFEYVPQNADGSVASSVKSSFDVAANKIA
jgi:type VI secretion system secreted protein Hcp